MVGAYDWSAPCPWLESLLSYITSLIGKDSQHMARKNLRVEKPTPSAEDLKWAEDISGLSRGALQNQLLKAIDRNHIWRIMHLTNIPERIEEGSILFSKKSFLPGMGKEIDLHFNESLPLRRAIANDNMDATKYLLYRGALTNETAYSIYWQCMRQDRTEILELLLKNYIKPDGDMMQEMLQACCLNGQRDMAELLLDHGCDARAHGSISLAYAAKSGDMDVVKLMIEHGADISSRFNRAARWARKSGKKDIESYLERSKNKPMDQFEMRQWRLCHDNSIRRKDTTSNKHIALNTVFNFKTRKITKIMEDMRDGTCQKTATYDFEDYPKKSEILEAEKMMKYHQTNNCRKMPKNSI